MMNTMRSGFDSRERNIFLPSKLLGFDVENYCNGGNTGEVYDLNLWFTVKPKRFFSTLNSI